MAQKLLTPQEAATLKGVTRSAIYKAIAEGRLPHTRILGRVAIREDDVQVWEPIKYRGRPGRSGGREPGTRLSDETKARISEAQKHRWTQRKREDTNNSRTSKIQ
ncbi:MAG: helix-turn-helix domain-containing protein [Abitibacteriaceae bacterium]|nr:helix-turn-helix domain-containing protein [Abditibacteriaceae bacterium]